MALNGHAASVGRCPLWVAKRTYPNEGVKSANDPSETSAAKFTVMQQPLSDKSAGAR